MELSGSVAEVGVVAGTTGWDDLVGTEVVVGWFQVCVLFGL